MTSKFDPKCLRMRSLMIREAIHKKKKNLNLSKTTRRKFIQMCVMFAVENHFGTKHLRCQQNMRTMITFCNPKRRKKPRHQCFEKNIVLE